MGQWAVGGLAVLAFATAGGTVSAQEQLLGAHLTTSAEFPDSLTFSLQVQTPILVERAEVRYQIDQISCASSTASGFPEFVPSADVDVSWEWDLRERGGLPVGTRVTYWWVLTSGERSFGTEHANVVFEDPRFEWRTVTGEHTRLMWYKGDVGFAEELLAVAEEGIRQLSDSAGVLRSRPVEVRIYENPDAMRGATVFGQEWAGGVAYPSNGLVIIGVDERTLAWGRTAMVHEMSHVVLAEATATCGASLPAWLNEGLATFNEGPEEPQFAVALDQALRNDSAYTVRGLAGSFPGSRDAAVLAYAQSRSLVAYLVTTHGSDRMSALLDAFRELGTIDRALIDVYGFDSDGLEARWREDVGLPARSPRPDVELEPLPEIPALGLPLGPAEQGPAATPEQETNTPTPEPAESSGRGGGSGCNRSDGESAGLDLGALAGLALGGLVVGRRLL